MIFVSLTSAYVVRRGLPTLDERTNTYVRDWIPVDLPIALLLVNTLPLLVSSIRAPGLRYAEPSTRTTVARQTSSPCARAVRQSSRIRRSSAMLYTTLLGISFSSRMGSSRTRMPVA